jgi:hypothetical protein
MHSMHMESHKLLNYIPKNNRKMKGQGQKECTLKHSTITMNCEKTRAKTLLSVIPLI